MGSATEPTKTDHAISSGGDHMAMTHLLASLLVLVTSQAAAQATPKHGVGPDVPEGFVLIDGAAHPEQIPEYLAWDHGLRGFGIIRRDHLPVPDSLAALPEGDKMSIFAAGIAQFDRDEQCVKDQRIAKADLKDAKAEALGAALRRVILQCRWRVLDAEEQLLERLTPEGRVAVNAWIDKTRSDTKSYVPKNELAFYRQPR